MGIFQQKETQEEKETLQLQLKTQIEQNKERIITEYSKESELYPWAMEHLSDWLSDTDIHHETVCQMYEYFLQTLETIIQLPPSLSSKEAWKNGAEIGYSRYDISNQGRVINSTNKRFLKGRSLTDYVKYNMITDDNKKISISAHKLVAMIFIPNPENKPSIDHINRIRSDNRALNLRWATLSEQAINRKNRDPKYHAVYQYDLEENFIRKWGSTTEILAEIDGSRSSLMNACSKGLIYRNYRWFYDYLVEIDKDEEWLPSYLEGHERFEISSKGRIRRPNGKIHEGNINELYRSVKIWNDVTEKYDTFKIHILVATAFLGKHEGLVVNHKNGNKHDNNIENLEFVTRSENTFHAYRTGLTKMPNRVIRQINKETGEIIAEYQNISEAVRNTGTDGGGITAVCQGVQHTAGGFIWKYVNNNEEEIKQEMINRAIRSVRQINKDTGEIIAEYHSAKIAALQTGLSYASIDQACRGYSKTSGGFIWEYII